MCGCTTKRSEATNQGKKKAISPQGLQKNMQTLLFFVAAMTVRACGCSEGSPEFSRRIDITKSAIADLVEALADGGVHVKVMNSPTYVCS